VINHGKYNVAGINIHAVDYEYAVEQILQAAQQREAFGVSALAVHGVMTGALDPEHAVRLNQLNLVVPDGQPVRWALNWLHGLKLADRVYGPDLTLHTAEAMAQADLGVYLYGSSQQVLDEFSRNLKSQFPTLNIVGSEPSKFGRISREEQQAIADGIRNSGARVVFVGLGCPRQEVWVYEHLKLLDMPMLAVGAAFDFHAGLLPQAPAFMQRRGLEWLFRLWHEPKRLWQRYLILNPKYVWRVLLQKKGSKPRTDIAGRSNAVVNFVGYG
jgi:N-acetylglucosaminyldiphosphoundecaprenol N-acetyl-beta-D-mannosaminyltransferase